MRIGVLICGDTVAPWQRKALELLPSDTDFTVIKATSPGPSAPRRLLQHGAYYGLNVLSIREKRVPVLDLFENAPIMEFEPEVDGMWSRFPDTLLLELRAAELDAVVKFGLSLLRVPTADQLAVPILSYHHGDPREYRGRPSGFYETKHGRESVGQIVQQISNKLDGGRVFAFAETPVFPYSYRKTLSTARALSPYLLPRALSNLHCGESEDLDPVGKNYRLPGNSSVAAHALRTGWEKAKRSLYGAFVEKKWCVSTVQLTGDGLLSSLENIEIEAHRWKTFDLPAGYTFVADPFFDRQSDAIFVEALETGSGVGRLLRIDHEDVDRIVREDYHLSYPSNFIHEDQQILLPEMMAGGRQKFFALRDGRVTDARELDIDASGLIDPTMFRDGETFYLFGGEEVDGSSVLRLWSSGSLSGRFVEHPASPIRVSARGSRMGGPILSVGGKIYRTGQDHRRAYGDGVLLFEIEELTPTAYREREVKRFAFKNRSGPHTLDLKGQTLLFDWYVDTISPFAGWRRLRGKLARR